MEAQRGLDNLPEDIYYHHLLPYLNRYDIFALRQVNQNFNGIFRGNRFWSRFLHYPMKYYLCDLNSRSEAEGIAVILQEILLQGENPQWLHFCRLQEAHLRNWVAGRNNLYDTINLPIRDMAFMEEMVYDNNTHWVCFSVCETLRFWNITAQPVGIDPVNVGPHALVRLSTCGKVLVKGDSGCIITVYELMLEMETIQFRYIFKFDEEAPRNDRDLGRDAGNTLCSMYFRFILMDHIFIGYMNQLPKPQDCFLHLWNMSENNKWHTQDLAGIIQVFENFLRMNKATLGQRYHLNIFEGEWPRIIVVLKYITNQLKFSQINVFDISMRCFTHLIAQTSSEVISCSIYRNKISVVEKILSLDSVNTRVSIYSVPEEQTGNRGANEIPANEEGAVLLQDRCLYEYNCGQWSVVLKKSKLFIRTSTEVITIMTDPFIHRSSMPVEDGYKMLGFLEPKLLLMYDSYKNPTDTVIRVYNIVSQRLICSWDQVNIYASRFQHYFTNLIYPSKLILNIGNQDQFRVYNF